MDVSEEEHEASDREENASDNIDVENNLGPVSSPIALNDTLCEDLELDERSHVSETQISRHIARPNNSEIRPRQRSWKKVALLAILKPKMGPLAIMGFHLNHQI